MLRVSFLICVVISTCNKSFNEYGKDAVIKYPTKWKYIALVVKQTNKQVQIDLFFYFFTASCLMRIGPIKSTPPWRKGRTGSIRKPGRSLLNDKCSKYLKRMEANIIYFFIKD